MPSKTFATNDVLTAADVNLMNLDPQAVTVATDETTTSTSYVNLATVGPTVVVNLNAGQKVQIEVSCWGLNAGHNDQVDTAYMSFAVSGASTLAANDANGVRLTTCKLAPLNNIATSTVSQSTIFTATGTGAHTFQAKYKSLDATITWHFIDRRLVVNPKF